MSTQYPWKSVQNSPSPVCTVQVVRTKISKECAGASRLSGKVFIDDVTRRKIAKEIAEIIARDLEKVTEIEVYHDELTEDALVEVRFGISPARKI